MLKKVFLPLILSCILILPCHAQVDTEFWFAAPEVSSQHADKPVFLRVSSLQNATTFTISQPANTTFAPQTYSLGANKTISIDLTSHLASLENTPPDEILTYGLHIIASNPITAYYEVLGTSFYGIGVNSDIFVLKGSHALGKEFYVPFQTHWDNNHTALNDAWASFDIVASENNTLVTITPSTDLVGHPAGITYNITLQKGQTYSAQAASPLASARPTGSHIVASKPIAVTVKDDSILEEGSYDLAGDQIIPIEYIGTEYIAVKISSTHNTDRVYVVATKPNTTVYQNGSSVATLQEGESYEIHLLTPSVYITASDSVYLWQVGGFDNELGGAILPPLGCTGSRQVSFTRSTDENFFVVLVVRSGYEDYFSLNGSATLIPGSVFNDVAGSAGAWKYAKLPFDPTVIPTNSANQIQNDSSDFQLSILNGASTTGFRFGYFSDFGFLELGSDKGICEGDSIKLDAGALKNSYLWNTGATSQFIVVQDTGTYHVTVTKGICQMRDSVNVYFLPKVTGAILPADTAACINDRLQLKTISRFSSYLWNTGSTEPSLKPMQSGEYTVEVTNEFGCKTRDTMQVTLHPAPVPAILYDQDLSSFCKSEQVHLEANADYAHYQWSTGDTTKSITTPHNENDYFTLQVTNHFGCSRSTQLEIDCSPVIGLVPNLLTPNNDGKNDVFYVEYLRPGTWAFEVYNRWGERIYQNLYYDNSFDPKELNDGIYYFSLRHKEGKGEKKGWLHIIR